MQKSRMRLVRLLRKLSISFGIGHQNNTRKIQLNTDDSGIWKREWNMALQ
jgi:hypothetical protein